MNQHNTVVLTEVENKGWVELTFSWDILYSHRMLLNMITTETCAYPCELCKTVVFTYNNKGRSLNNQPCVHNVG